MATFTTRLIDYRLIAQSALEYVKKKMTVGASNKLRDVFSSSAMSLLCVIAERSVTSEQSFGEYDAAYLRMVAGVAENTGCGNCGEQAAVAFVYLMDRGIRPLSFMALPRPGDHAFVVVGRPAGSDIRDPGTWTGAVVCDPWKGEIYEPLRIAQMWGLLPEELYRLE